MKNLIGAICVTGVLLGAVSCNMLSQDPDLAKPVGVTKEVTVSENGSTVIDLKSKIQIAGGASLAITRQPRKGSLKALGQGLLEYTPTQLHVKTRDNFEYTVYALNSRVLEQDSIIIIVGGDSTSCVNAANTDYAYIEAPYDTADIYPAFNDIFCSFDSSEMILSIVSDSFPKRGTASVLGNRRIHYIGNNNTQLSDLIHYKIQNASNPSDVLYGTIVIMQGPAPCISLLHDDYFYFNYDSITPGDTLRMRFLDNDIICATSGNWPNNVIVDHDFENGVSRLRETLYPILSYYPDPIASGTTRWDSLTYKICYDGNCLSAKVRVQLVRP